MKGAQPSTNIIRALGFAGGSSSPNPTLLRGGLSLEELLVSHLQRQQARVALGYVFQARKAAFPAAL